MFQSEVFHGSNFCKNLRQLQSWQVKSSLGAVWAQNSPLLSLKADDDPQMSLQLPTITSFIGTTVEGRHLQSKTENGRLESVRPQANFSPDRIVVSEHFN